MTFIYSHRLSSQSRPRIRSVYKSAFTRPHVMSEPSVSTTVSLLDYRAPQRLCRLASTFTPLFAVRLSSEALCHFSGSEKRKKNLARRAKVCLVTRAESLQSSSAITSSSRPAFVPQPSAVLGSTTALWAPRLLQSSSCWNRPELSGSKIIREKEKQKAGQVRDKKSFQVSFSADKNLQLSVKPWPCCTSA